MNIDQENPTLGLADWWPRIWRHRLLFLVCAFLGWAAGTTIGALLPARYRSETVILIEQQRVPEHYVEPNIAIDLQVRLQTMSEQILSRTRLMGIIEKFGLYPKAKGKIDSDAIVEAMRKDIGINLVRNDGRGVSAFKVSYSANSPFIAQQVTAELTSLFIGEDLRNRTLMSENTTAFLEMQLDAARKNLEEQEQRLREFKTKYLGQLPEQTASNVQILAGLQARLQAATDALNQAQQQRLYLQSLMAEYRSIHPAGAQDNGSTSALPPSYELDQRLEKLRSQLADLRAKYTELHPDIVRVKQEIAATTQLRDEAEKQRKAADPETTQVAQSSGNVAERGNTPFLQVASQLKANQLDIDNRQREIKRIEAEVESYQQRLNLAPAREQEMAALTRDHEQSRAYYDSLLAKRNQSGMATDLERQQQGEQFRMIDPPSLPQKPYSPNRLMFCFAGLGGGFALAVVMLAVLEFASPRLYREEEVRNLIESPMVISIPPVITEAEKRRTRAYQIAEAACAFVFALVMPVVTFLVYRKS